MVLVRWALLARCDDLGRLGWRSRRCEARGRRSGRTEVQNREGVEAQRCKGASKQIDKQKGRGNRAK